MGIYSSYTYVGLLSIDFKAMENNFSTNPILITILIQIQLLNTYLNVTSASDGLFTYEGSTLAGGGAAGGGGWATAGTGSRP